MLRPSPLPIALVVLLALLLGAPSEALAVGPAEYRAAIRAALDDLRSGEPGAPARAADRVRAASPVSLPDGGAIHPDNSAILASLEASPPRVATAEAGLRALLAALDRAERPAPGASRANSQARLQRILQRPEFGPIPPPGPVASLLQSLQARLGEALSRALEPVGRWLAQVLASLLGEDTAVGSGLRFAGPPLALLAVAGLVAWVYRRLRRELAPDVVGASREASPARPTAEQARAEAERLAAAGDYRAAIRALGVAALLRCDELGRVRFDRSLTNQEVLGKARLQGDEGLAAHLAPLLQAFDRCWYGGASCSRESYAAVADQASAIWELRRE